MSIENDKRPRGRPRAYDPEAALRQLTEAFWHGGFAGTSMDALSDATGMNRPSLYGAFGDKRAMYFAAMKHYMDVVARAMGEVFRAAMPLEQALDTIYDLALRQYYPREGPAFGCFLLGTAVTESYHDEEVRALLSGALHAFDAAFEARLKRAQKEGELAKTADPKVLAKIGSALLHTLGLRSRAGDAEAELRATARAGVRMICAAA